MSSPIDYLLPEAAKTYPGPRVGVGEPGPQTVSLRGDPVLRGIGLLVAAMIVFALAGLVEPHFGQAFRIEGRLLGLSLGVLGAAVALRVTGRSLNLAASASPLHLTARALALFTVVFCLLALLHLPDAPMGTLRNILASATFWYLGLVPVVVVLLARTFMRRRIPVRTVVAVLFLAGIEVVFLRVFDGLVPTGFLWRLEKLFAPGTLWLWPLVLGLAVFLLLSRVCARRSGLASLLFWDGLTILCALVVFLALGSARPIQISFAPFVVSAVFMTAGWTMAARALSWAPAETLAPFLVTKTAFLAIVAGSGLGTVPFAVEYIANPIIIIPYELLSPLWVGIALAIVLLVLFRQERAARWRAMQPGKAAEDSTADAPRPIWPGDKPLKAVHCLIIGSGLIGLAAVIDAQTGFSLAIEGRVLAYAVGGLLLAILTRSGGRLHGLAPARPLGLFVVRIAALLLACWVLIPWLHVPEGAEMGDAHAAAPAYWALAFLPFSICLLAGLFLREKLTRFSLVAVVMFTLTEICLLHLAYWSTLVPTPAYAMWMVAFFLNSDAIELWGGLLGLAAYFVLTRRLAPTAGYRSLLFWDCLALLGAIGLIVASGALPATAIFLTAGFDPGIMNTAQSVLGYLLLGAAGWAMLLAAFARAEATRLAPFMCGKTVVLLLFLIFVGTHETELRQASALEMIDPFVSIVYPYGSSEPIVSLTLPIYWVALFFASGLCFLYWRERRDAKQKSPDLVSPFD